MIIHLKWELTDDKENVKGKMNSTSFSKKSQTEVVYIINSLHVGGAEMGMCRLLNGLESAKYKVTVVSLDGYGREFVKQIPSWVDIINLHLNSNPDIGMFRRFISAVRSADVIVGSLFHSAIAARGMSIINRRATVVTWHHSNRFKTKWRGAIFKNTDWLNDIVLADSDPVSDMLQSELGLKNKAVHTVPIAGIDLDQFSEVRHVGTDSVTVGSIGRMVKSKNYATLLEVAEKVPDWITFEVAGDGERMDDLKHEMQQRKISNVTFHGEISDIPSFLETLDIYFQPSLYEGLCITVIEAMAAGLPVVGADVGGISQNVTNGENGFLFDPYNVEGYADAIEELAADAEQREQLGSNGRKIVERAFTQERLVEEFKNAVMKAKQ